MTLMTTFLEEGGREKRKTVGVSADLKSADKKGSTYFFADS